MGTAQKVRLKLVHDAGRPITRADCANVVRPCPYAECRHHLPLSAACVLDIADQGGADRTDVAAALGIGRNWARRLEAAAIAKVRKRWARLEKGQ